MKSRQWDSKKCRETAKQLLSLREQICTQLERNIQNYSPNFDNSPIRQLEVTRLELALKQIKHGDSPISLDYLVKLLTLMVELNQHGNNPFYNGLPAECLAFFRIVDKVTNRHAMEVNQVIEYANAFITTPESMRVEVDDLENLPRDKKSPRIDSESINPAKRGAWQSLKNFFISEDKNEIGVFQKADLFGIKSIDEERAKRFMQYSAVTALGVVTIVSGNLLALDVVSIGGGILTVIAAGGAAGIVIKARSENAEYNESHDPLKKLNEGSTLEQPGRLATLFKASTLTPTEKSSNTSTTTSNRLFSENGSVKNVGKVADETINKPKIQ